ncbi:hypothetical protein MMC08_004065 [Hypocenomyce scalaris]|nr:hypothetical protein [Hypocenomyce scalaris]
MGSISPDVTSNGEAPEVGEQFIKDAVDGANANALRLALYQVTGDSSLGDMNVNKEPIRGGAMMDFNLSKEDEAIVREKALTWLLKEQSETPKPAPTHVPSLDEGIALMKVFCGEKNPPGDAELALGYEELAFEDYPRGVKWTKKPSAEKLAKYHVVIVGAGINGISAAVSLNRLGIPYTIIERQAAVGGTWLLNTYPEARVDTLGFSFQYKFEKGYRWQEMFPSALELRTYLEHVANKYGVTKNCIFNRELVGATWDEGTNVWKLKLRVTDSPDGEDDSMEANSIISAGGLFATVNLPDIAGINDFKGHMFHTTAWDHNVSYKDMNVAVIGNGSSGAQLVPGLARDVKHLSVYMRTPNWIAPYEGYRAAVPATLAWILAKMPYYHNWHGYAGFLRGMQLPPLQVDDPEWRQQGGFINMRNDGMRKGLTEYIRSKVNNDEGLVRKLTPKQAPLVRRLVVDNGFYDAIMQPNVELVTERIKNFTPGGILTNDAKERKFDLVVLGCGFKPTEYLFPCNYVGRNGVTLDKTWAKDGARSYLGLTIPGYPNLFTLYGPNHQPRGGPSIHSWSEIWGRYAIASIVWMLENDKKSVEVKQEVYDEYNQRLDAAMSKLIWELDPTSYFVNKHGRQGVNMPWTADQYHGWVRKPDWNDYHVS